MAFDHHAWIEKYLSSPDFPNYNDAVEYDVSVVRQDATADKPHWRIIGVHHLISEENDWAHHIYLDFVDEAGNQMPIEVEGQAIMCSYTWDGIQEHELRIPHIVRCDKPPNEPRGHLAMERGQVIHTRTTGYGIDLSNFDAFATSDWASGLHTAHPDEAPGNTVFHHSFHVCLQRVIGAPPPLPPPPVAIKAVFTATPRSGTAPLSVTFSDRSEGEPTSRTWTLINEHTGEQLTSEAKVFARPMAAGDWTVKLTVRKDGQVSDAEIEKYIEVKSISREVGVVKIIYIGNPEKEYDADDCGTWLNVQDKSPVLFARPVGSSYLQVQVEADKVPFTDGWVYFYVLLMPPKEVE